MGERAYTAEMQHTFCNLLVKESKGADLYLAQIY